MCQLSGNMVDLDGAKTAVDRTNLAKPLVLEILYAIVVSEEDAEIVISGGGA